MAKIAKLIKVSLMTRVVVDEKATDEQIFNEAMCKLKVQLHHDKMENIENIEDDTECPFGTLQQDDSPYVNHPDFNFL